MALLPVADALARIVAGVKPLGPEMVTLKAAYGRILARSITATRDQPPFDASAMDGYAVRYTDIQMLPAHLHIVGTAAAGRAFKGVVKPGTAVRILTGAPLPRGADTIVIQENTNRSGDALEVFAATANGKNVRRRGLDFKRGHELMAAGTRLNSRDIGLAAAGNAAKVVVRKAPHLVLFTTGDELVLPGEKPRADQIVSSNSSALETMATGWGARVTNIGIVRDTLRATETAVQKGLGADILITTGGASVGDHDFVQQAFKNCGVKIDFWKIALRPGKPLMFGRKGKTRVIGLPGNPVSALVCSRIFLKPLIHALQGILPDDEHPLAKLGADLGENDNRQDYIRATLEVHRDGSRTALPFATQDSSMQRTLRNSQCLIVRSPFAPAVKAGELIEILPLDF